MGRSRAVMKSLSHNTRYWSNYLQYLPRDAERMHPGCNTTGRYTTRAFRVRKLAIGVRARARARELSLPRKPTLKQTNTRAGGKERDKMKGEQFSRNRKRPARAARDEKFSISPTIIVALVAFTADARFQSRHPLRPVECILFTIPRARPGAGKTVTRARGTV